MLPPLRVIEDQQTLPLPSPLSLRPGDFVATSPHTQTILPYRRCYQAPAGCCSLLRNDLDRQSNPGSSSRPLRSLSSIHSFRGIVTALNWVEPQLLLSCPERDKIFFDRVPANISSKASTNKSLFYPSSATQNTLRAGRYFETG